MEISDRVYVLPEAGDEAADIVFPSGKSATPGTTHQSHLPKAKRGESRNRNVARGNYGDKNVSRGGAVGGIRQNKGHSEAPEPLRTPLQSGIFKLVEASVRSERT